MKKLRFKKIDAFATEYSSGNPAAVVYLDTLEDLSEDEKLRIAKELKGFVSEVGYVSPGTETDYKLCYFSSEREVAFCGHATIAIMNDLVANNEALHSQTTLSIATRTDQLKVENRYRDEKSVYISAPSPTFGYLEDPATGSGNSAFGYYLLAHGMWNGDKIRIEQNGFRNAPNFVQIFSPKTDASDSRVWFGGSAIVKIDGQYNLK